MLKKTTDIIIFGWLGLSLVILLFLIAIAITMHFFQPEMTNDLVRGFFHLPFPLPAATAVILGQVFFSFSSVLFLQFYFKKTVSPEIFFFSAALLSLSFEGFRLLSLVSLAGISSMQNIIIITRLVYFGRLLGIFALFSSGLFSNGLVFQKQELLFWISVLIALFIAGSIPIDISSRGSYLLHAVNIDSSLAMSLIIFYLIAVINFSLAAIRNNTTEYFWLSAGMFLVIAGKELLHLMPASWIPLLGFPLLIAGAALFSYRTHKIYLWF